MKKTIIIILGLLFIAVIGIVLAVNFLENASSGEIDQPEDITQADDTAIDNDVPSIVSTEPEDDNPIKTYDNGVATFTYDSTKVYFDEMPAENTDGIPQSWFFMVESDSAIPSITVFPMVLEKAFTADVTKEDWEDLAKAFILSYFTTDVQSLVDVKFSGTALKIEDETAKMYVSFDCDVLGSPENNMNGVVRLVSNASYAMVTVAIVQDGQSMPQELIDTYMSVELY